MKYKRTFLLLCLPLCAGPALAEPPPGHPSTDAAAKQLHLREGQAYAFRGKVLQAIDSNAYTYIQVQMQQETLWLAAPRLSLTEGQEIRFPAGTVMPNFYSRKLKATFSSVMFVAGVEVVHLEI